jgi:hypothetical protein
MYTVTQPIHFYPEDASWLATCFMLVSHLVYSSTLKTKLTCISVALVDFQQTMRRYIPEDWALYNHCCWELLILQNLKINLLFSFLEQEALILTNTLQDSISKSHNGSITIDSIFIDFRFRFISSPWIIIHDVGQVNYYTITHYNTKVRLK